MIDRARKMNDQWPNLSREQPAVRACVPLSRSTSGIGGCSRVVRPLRTTIFMNTETCPKCGTAERARGQIFQQGTMNDVRFKADDAPTLSLKKQVLAFACPKCGFIEFFLADHED